MMSTHCADRLLGPEFGNFVDHNEPIFDRIARYRGPEKRQRTTAVCDPTNARTSYASKATDVVRCSDDDELIDAVIEQVQKHDLVFARMMDLGTIQGCKSGLICFGILVCKLTRP